MAQGGVNIVTLHTPEPSDWNYAKNQPGKGEARRFWLYAATACGDGVVTMCVPYGPGGRKIILKKYSRTKDPDTGDIQYGDPKEHEDGHIEEDRGADHHLHDTPVISSGNRFVFYTTGHRDKGCVHVWDVEAAQGAIKLPQCEDGNVKILQEDDSRHKITFTKEDERAVALLLTSSGPHLKCYRMDPLDMDIVAEDITESMPGEVKRFAENLARVDERRTYIVAFGEKFQNVRLSHDDGNSWSQVDVRMDLAHSDQNVQLDHYIDPDGRGSLIMSGREQPLTAVIVGRDDSSSANIKPSRLTIGKFDVAGNTLTLRNHLVFENPKAQQNEINRQAIVSLSPSGNYLAVVIKRNANESRIDVYKLEGDLSKKPETFEPINFPYSEEVCNIAWVSDTKLAVTYLTDEAFILTFFKRNGNGFERPGLTTDLATKEDGAAMLTTKKGRGRRHRYDLVVSEDILVASASNIGAFVVHIPV